MIVLAIIKPFIFAQKVMIVEDNGVCHETRLTTIKDLPENICALANMYNCKDVKIQGSKKYAQKIADKTNALFNAKFAKANEFTLEIENI